MKLLGAILIGAMASSGAALAQDVNATSGCAIQAKNMCAPAGSARLAAANGEVLLSRGAGFSEIKPGASLVAGDRLLVKQGGANLALGPACQTRLGANSMVTLVEKDGVLCAARLSSDPKTVAQGGRDERGQSPVPYIIVGGGLTTAFAAIMANRGRDRALERAPVFVSP